MGTRAASVMRCGLGVVLLLVVPVMQAAAPTHVLDTSALATGDPLGAWTGKPLSLADIDLDGDLDVVAQNANGHVVAIDIPTGAVIIDVLPRYPYGPDLGPFNGPRVADLDGDGHMELVNVNRAAVVSVWRIVANGDTVSAEFLWDRHLNDHHERPTSDAGPTLADLDGDGKLDILVHTEERGAYALRHDGARLWSVDEYGGNAEAAARDVDGDGDIDAVFFTDGGVVYAIDGPTGELLWRFDARHRDVWPGSVVTTGIVDDLDGDGRVEVAFCMRNVENATTASAPGAPYYRQHHLALILLRDGEMQWLKKPAWANPLCAAYLMAYDVDGDGRKEILGLDWNTIGHKPGDWERLGPAHAFAFELNGKERWHRALDPFNAKATVAIADVDGDGIQEFIAYGEKELILSDPATGAIRSRWPLPGAVKQGPVVGVAPNGDAWLVLATERQDAIVAYRVPSTAALAAWSGSVVPARPASAPAAVLPTPDEPPPHAPADTDWTAIIADRQPLGGVPVSSAAEGDVGASAAWPPALWLVVAVVAMTMVRATMRRSRR